MATGNDILSFRGDAGAGLADSSSFNPTGVIDVTPVTGVARDIALNLVQRGMMLYKQKVQERDQAYDLLDKGTIVPDNILEEDRAAIEEKRKKIFDIFNKHNGDLQSDPSVYREFSAAVRDADGYIKQAQKWYLSEEALQAEKKKYLNPIDQRKIDTHREKQLGKKRQNIWAIPEPYAPISHFELPIVHADPVVSTSTTSDGGGLYDVTTTEIDVPTTFNHYDNNFTQPQYNHMFGEYLDNMLNVPNSDELVSRVQQGIKNFNAAGGYKPGDKNFLEDLKVYKDPAGAWHLGEGASKAAAKIALSEKQPRAVSRAFNKDVSARDIALRKLAEQGRHNRATEGIGRMKAKAYVDSTRAKMAQMKSISQQDNLLESLWKENLLQQPRLFEPDNKTKQPRSILPAFNSAPLFTFNGGAVQQLKPIGAEPIYADPKAFNKKQIGWKGGHYNIQYLNAEGQAIPTENLGPAYREFKRILPTWNGGFDDYLKLQIERDNFKVRMIGENGATDENIHKSAMRVIANKNTSKGEVSVFDLSGDAPPVDETTSESSSSSVYEKDVE